MSGTKGGGGGGGGSANEVSLVTSKSSDKEIVTAYIRFDEQTAIANRSFSAINSKLRRGQILDPVERAAVKRLDEIIGSADKFTGTTYRIEFKKTSEMQIGKSFTSKQFWSSATDMKSIGSTAGASRIYEITAKGKRGADISRIRFSNTSTHEVVFRPKTQFRVIGITKNSKGQEVISIEEV